MTPVGPNKFVKEIFDVENRPWQKLYDFNVPKSIRYPRVPIQNLFHLTAATFPDKAALSMGGSEITFWQLREQLLRLANALGKMGIGKGDRVGLHMPNCPQFVIAYLAVLSVGAIVVNMRSGSSTPAAPLCPPNLSIA